MSGILTLTTGGVFILLINRYAVVIQASVTPTLLVHGTGTFPTIKCNRLVRTLSKRRMIQIIWIFFFTFTIPHGPLESCRNQSRILPHITNRSVQAQTQEPKAFSEQRSDLTHMFFTQQIKVYFHEVAKQIHSKILLIIQRKSWYNYEKELTISKSY